MIEHGEALYAEHCGRCHGGALMSSAVVPDLRRLPAAKHAVFRRIVLDGILQGTGMVGFADVLDEADADDIQAYVLDVANDQWEESRLPGWWRETKAWVFDQAAGVIAWFMG
jgi:quinohemoprotein ethanol dehydrogenase